jgi:hypothetical protein
MKRIISCMGLTLTLFLFTLDAEGKAGLEIGGFTNFANINLNVKINDVPIRVIQSLPVTASPEVRLNWQFGGDHEILFYFTYSEFQSLERIGGALPTPKPWNLLIPFIPLGGTVEGHLSMVTLETLWKWTGIRTKYIDFGTTLGIRLSWLKSYYDIKDVTVFGFPAGDFIKGQHLTAPDSLMFFVQPGLFFKARVSVRSFFEGSVKAGYTGTYAMVEGSAMYETGFLKYFALSAGYRATYYYLSIDQTTGYPTVQTNGSMLVQGPYIGLKMSY